MREHDVGQKPSGLHPQPKWFTGLIFDCQKGGAMTDAQSEKMERFMASYGAGHNETQVLEDIDGMGILGLPTGWILVTITRHGLTVHMGIDPDGRGHM